MKCSYFIVVFLLLETISKAGGQTCCSGGVPLANSIGGLPVVDSGTIQVSVQGDLNILNTLKDESRTLNDNSRSRKTWSFLMHAGISLTHRLSMEGLFSWVRQERLIRQQGGFEDFTATQGIGDGIVLAQYRWWNRNRLRFVAGGGVKLPLGSSDQKNNNGISLNADLQPGTGALDYVITQKVEWVQVGGSLLNLAGNMVYRITGTNDTYLQSQNYRFGNEFQVSAGLRRQFFVADQLIDVQVGFRFRSTSEDLINGVILANTGGRWLYGNLGALWNFTPSFSISAAVDLPIYSHVTGTQLSPTARFNMGCYYLIKTKDSSWKSF